MQGGFVHMIGGFCPPCKTYEGGFVHPFISCRGCYVHPVKNMRGALSTYAKMSRGCFVRGVFCPTFEKTKCTFNTQFLGLLTNFMVSFRSVTMSAHIFLVFI